MIELGRLTIHNPPAFNESRRKILRLTQALDFDSLLSAKLATLFSELTRPHNGSGIEVALFLDRESGSSLLALHFSYPRRVRPESSLSFFFDGCEIRHGNKTTDLQLRKYLPHDDFWPDTDFIAAQREMLARPSREELLGDLKDKNERLQQEIIDRKKAEAERRQRLKELTEARWAMLNIMEDIEASRKATADALEVISGSINYASHIQQAILPDESLFKNAFNDFFILWKPRDVVGGDIYWAVPWNGGLLLALGDCTGHGVPGAFMTLITTAALDRAKSESEGVDIASIVARMHQIVQKSLNQHQKEGTSDDGMELGVCYLEEARREMIYVGTRFPLFVLENGELNIIKGDKKAIGYRSVPHDQQYTEIRINLRPGQRFYMASDGLLDQIGGPKRRSYGKKRFMKLIQSFNDIPMCDQGDLIYEALVDYQGKESRRDDVSVLGFEI